MSDEDRHLHEGTVLEDMVVSVPPVPDDHRHMTNTTIEDMLVDLRQEGNMAHHPQGDMKIHMRVGPLHLLHEAMILTLGEIPMQDLAAHHQPVDMEAMVAAAAAAVAAIVGMMIDHTRYASIYATLPHC